MNNLADTRWLQRFDSYERALAALERAAAIAEKRALSELEEQGLIQSFEFTHELSWNLLKDYLEYKSFADIHGSRDSTRTALREGYIENGEIWMDMIESRNKSSHTYNSDTAQSLVSVILDSYIAEFRALYKRMKDYAEEFKHNVRTS
jgi:nucleotidyltransferase substrate binding protein (TIGR01987 family)